MIIEGIHTISVLNGQNPPIWKLMINWCSIDFMCYIILYKMCIYFLLCPLQLSTVVTPSSFWCIKNNCANWGHLTITTSDYSVAVVFWQEWSPEYTYSGSPPEAHFVLHENRVSGTVWGPLLTQKSPTCTYITQKLRGSGNCVCDFCVSGGLSVFSTLTTRTDSFFDHKLHFQDSIVIQSMHYFWY